MTKTNVEGTIISVTELLLKSKETHYATYNILHYSKFRHYPGIDLPKDN